MRLRGEIESRLNWTSENLKKLRSRSKLRKLDLDLNLENFDLEIDLNLEIFHLNLDLNLEKIDLDNLDIFYLELNSEKLDLDLK